MRYIHVEIEICMALSICEPLRSPKLYRWAVATAAASAFAQARPAGPALRAIGFYGSIGIYSVCIYIYMAVW